MLELTVFLSFDLNFFFCAGGSAKTIMVVQVSPVVKNVDETVNSLNFATRVRSVELGASKKQAESAEVVALKKRIKDLEGVSRREWAAVEVAK